MTVSAIAIKHFQSIDSLSLKLGKFTVFTGRSNSGKSAVVRAISHLVFNHRGRSFQPPGHSTTVVVLAIDEHKIIWRRAASPKYILDEQSFEKLANEIPAAISNVVKMDDIEIGSYSVNINIRPQFAGAFFVSDTAPARSKVVSFLAGADSVSAATVEGIKRKRDLTVTKDALKNKQLLLEQFIDQEKQIAGLAVQVSHLVIEAESIDGLDAVIRRCIELQTDKISVLQMIEDVENSKAMLHLYPLDSKYLELSDMDAELERSDIMLGVRKLLFAKYREAKANMVGLEVAKESAREALIELMAAETEILLTIEVCPMCGQVLPEHIH